MAQLSDIGKDEETTKPKKKDTYQERYEKVYGTPAERALRNKKKKEQEKPKPKERSTLQKLWDFAVGNVTKLTEEAAKK